MNKKLFEGLKAGLEEAIAHQSDFAKSSTFAKAPADASTDKQGKINLRTETIEIPEPPTKADKRKIKLFH